MTTAAPVAEFDPRSPAYQRDPQHYLQPHLRDTPVFWSDELGAFCVLRYEDVRRLLADDQTLSNHCYQAVPIREDLKPRIPDAWYQAGQVIQGKQTINLEPPTHTAHRRAMQKAFTHKRVRNAKADIQAIADDLVDGFIAKGSADLMQDYAMQLTVRVVVTMMDVPRDMVPGFMAWIGDVFRILAPISMKPEDVTTPDDELVSIYERIHTAFETYTQFLAERREHPGDDLASAMLTVTDDDGRPSLQNDEVLAHMVGLTAAGTDTTANLIVSLLRLFTEHPDQRRLVLDNPDLWDNAVQEGLRRIAIATQVLRIARHDLEVGGVQIPAGSYVSLVLPAANADPERFEDPLRFDVTRADASDHVAFGRGRHFCLGSTLAPPEARIALETLYRRLPDLEADLEHPLEFMPILAVRALISQRATWTV